MITHAGSAPPRPEVAHRAGWVECWRWPPRVQTQPDIPKARAMVFQEQSRLWLDGGDRAAFGQAS